MEKQQIIVAVITAVISSSVLNGIITHILYSRKLRQEQKARAQNVVWDKIAESWDCVREIELKCSTIEIYGIDEILEGDENIRMFGGEGYYPAIMEDRDTFRDFMIEVNNARGKWGKYLDPEVGAYLYYMQNYCFQLMDYLTKNQLNEKYPLAGTVFIVDIANWQKKYEKLLVKRINKPKHKIYTEDGWLWETAKKNVVRRLWGKSVLNKMLSDDDSIETQIIKAFLFNTGDFYELLEDGYEYGRKHPIKRKLGKL